MQSRRCLYVSLGILALALANPHHPLGAAPAEAVIVVGGFDATRGGQGSFTSGSFFDSARDACQDNFGGVTFVSSSMLTPAFLTQVDVLIVSAIASNNDRIVPLTVEERQALSDFVSGGGALLALLDNDGFSETGIEAPFGLHCAGFLGGINTSTIVELGSPVATGPFGQVTAFSQAFTGHFDAVSPSGTVVAVNEQGPSLVTLDRDALGPGSGPCALFSDTQTFIDDSEIPWADFSNNAVLFLNTFAFLAPNVPTSTDATTWGSVKALFR